MLRMAPEAGIRHHVLHGFLGEIALRACSSMLCFEYESKPRAIRVVIDALVAVQSRTSVL